MVEVSTVLGIWCMAEYLAIPILTTLTILNTLAYLAEYDKFTSNEDQYCEAIESAGLVQGNCLPLQHVFSWAVITCMLLIFWHHTISANIRANLALKNGCCLKVINLLNMLTFKGTRVVYRPEHHASVQRKYPEEFPGAEIIFKDRCFTI